MALALTGEQMALVLIRGTGLSVKRQRELLNKLRAAAEREYAEAHANEPKPSPQLSYYHRKRQGLVNVKFAVDPDDAAEFLRMHGGRVLSETGPALSESFQNLIAKTLYFRKCTGED